jgi:hypothetical protein
MRHALAIIEWWKRSACHQGVTLAFLLAVMHHPDIDISSLAVGFPVGDRASSPTRIERTLESVSAFAGQVEQTVDLSNFMPMVLTVRRRLRGALHVRGTICRGTRSGG